MEVPEEQYPYPVEVAVDLARDFSAERFASAIAVCRHILALVIAEDRSSEQQIARVNILKYLDLQLSRAVRWIDQEADLMALVLRSLIELRFWADFVSENNENAERFLNEANTDSKDLYERLLKAFPNETTLVANLPGGKRVNPTRIDDQEELLWKVCTKFVHPTSLVLDSPGTTILNDGYRRLFAIKIVFYGWCILEMFHQINWTT
ncbi:MAG: hypothetical protein ABSH47_21230 [Bryobacteraceae bacterium]